MKYGRILHIREIVYYDGQFFKYIFQFFTLSYISVLFGVFLTVMDKVEDKVVYHRRCLCRCCSNCHLLLRRRASVCTFDHLFVWLRALGRLLVLHSFVLPAFLCRSSSCYCLCSGYLYPILTPITVLECIRNLARPQFPMRVKVDIPALEGFPPL